MKVTGMVQANQIILIKRGETDKAPTPKLRLPEAFMGFSHD